MQSLAFVLKAEGVEIGGGGVAHRPHGAIGAAALGLALAGWPYSVSSCSWQYQRQSFAMAAIILGSYREGGIIIRRLLALAVRPVCSASSCILVIIVGGWRRRRRHHYRRGVRLSHRPHLAAIGGPVFVAAAVTHAPNKRRRRTSASAYRRGISASGVRHAHRVAYRHQHPSVGGMRRRTAAHRVATSADVAHIICRPRTSCRVDVRTSLPRDWPHWWRRRLCDAITS